MYKYKPSNETDSSKYSARKITGNGLIKKNHSPTLSPLLVDDDDEEGLKDEDFRFLPFSPINSDNNNNNSSSNNGSQGTTTPPPRTTYKPTSSSSPIIISSPEKKPASNNNHNRNNNTISLHSLHTNHRRSSRGNEWDSEQMESRVYGDYDCDTDETDKDKDKSPIISTSEDEGEEYSPNNRSLSLSPNNSISTPTIQTSSSPKEEDEVEMVSINSRKSNGEKPVSSVPRSHSLPHNQTFLSDENLAQHLQSNPDLSSTLSQPPKTTPSSPEYPWIKKKTHTTYHSPATTSTTRTTSSPNLSVGSFVSARRLLSSNEPKRDFVANHKTRNEDDDFVEILSSEKGNKGAKNKTEDTEKSHTNHSDHFRRYSNTNSTSSTHHSHTHHTHHSNNNNNNNANNNHSRNRNTRTPAIVNNNNRSPPKFTLNNNNNNNNINLNGSERESDSKHLSERELQEDEDRKLAERLQMQEDQKYEEDKPQFRYGRHHSGDLMSRSGNNNNNNNNNGGSGFFSFMNPLNVMGFFLPTQPNSPPNHTANNAHPNPSRLPPQSLHFHHPLPPHSRHSSSHTHAHPHAQPQPHFYHFGGSRMGNRDFDPLMFGLGMVDRDFNENDYELLLRLDDNVSNKKGATKSEIDRLPTLVIGGQEKKEREKRKEKHQDRDGKTKRSRTDDFENETSSTTQQTESSEVKVETCCICLTEMGVGTMVKQLPCLHRFHPECIENWLLVNKVCPIDKTKVC